MKKNILFIIIFSSFTFNSCYVFKDPFKKYPGISAENLDLIISPIEKITNKSVDIKCTITNNKDQDIAFLPFYQEVTTFTDYKVYTWFAKIIHKTTQKEKFLLVYFFGDMNFPTENDYILIKPGEDIDIILNIDFSKLKDEEFSVEQKPNSDYGEYEITLWYNDNFKTHPNSINGKVVSNQIKVVYQK